MQETIFELIPIILTPFIYLFVEYVKSRNLSNKIERLRTDIEVTKQTNKELSYALTDVYHSSVFQLTFGFKILPSRVKGYTQLFRESNISETTFKYFYKRNYIIYDQEKQIPILKITKLSKIKILFDSIVFIVLLAIALLSIVFAQRIVDKLNLVDFNIVAYSVLFVAGMICYFFAMRNLFVKIIPYFDANRVIKKNKPK